MPSYKITIGISDAETARTLAGLLLEVADPPPDAVTQFEAGVGGWVVDAYYKVTPDPSRLAAQITSALNAPAPKITASLVPDKNWVAISQAALPPVTAGRFKVHGSHDRRMVARGPNRIIIDAGEAFGTAHHATTQGCLLALDRLTRRRQFNRVLDLGCGSGVLAIAAARALPHAFVEASDNDPVAIAVASGNASLNGVARRLRLTLKEGAPRPPSGSAYDLVLANILAEPLIKLAPALSRVVTPCGIAVLSGVLSREAAHVLAAYRSHGFVQLDHRREAGWSTMVLVRRCNAARSPCSRASCAA
jgi:ribosomal protein L11 methyltransferase